MESAREFKSELALPPGDDSVKMNIFGRLHKHLTLVQFRLIAEEVACPHGFDSLVETIPYAPTHVEVPVVWHVRLKWELSSCARNRSVSIRLSRCFNFEGATGLKRGRRCGQWPGAAWPCFQTPRDCCAHRDPLPLCCRKRI